MKRTILCLMVLVLIPCLAGCGDGGSAGNGSDEVYQLASIVVMGQEMTVEEYEAAGGGDELDLSVTLKSDGAVSMRMIDATTGGKVDYDGTWEEAGNRVVITAEGETLEMQKSGDSLTLDLGGDIQFVFQK